MLTSFWRLTGATSFALLALGVSLDLHAQTTKTKKDSTQKRDTTSMVDMPGMNMSGAHASPAMIAPLGIPMDRMGSGTTWLPDAVSLPARHFMTGSWETMLHGVVFVHEDAQQDSRGASQAGSLNWAMLMASHNLSGGDFQVRTMLSLDRWTVTNRGYPLLLQSGESFHGEPLHDRQHPHDFLMELGAIYERAVTRSVGVELYAAPSGEPALGPVAFMHRPSAMDNPAAPIGHHWQDATHIAFGVVTAGVFTYRWKFEGSVFNGREPDENRWNIDPIRLDSYSGRVTFNPTVNWSFTTGYGYLHEPEAQEPNLSFHRAAASALYGRKLGDQGQWAAAFVWGANAVSGAALSNSLLVESEAVLKKRSTVFGRAEWVQKSADDLVLDVPLASFSPDRRFGVSTLSLGYVGEIKRWSGATLGVGGMGTVNFIPEVLEPAYGSRAPLGLWVFVRLRPVHGPEMPMMNIPMGGMR